MDLEIIILREANQRLMISLIYGIFFLKNDTNELIYKIEMNSQIQKTNLSSEWKGRRDKLGVWN